MTWACAEPGPAGGLAMAEVSEVLPVSPEAPALMAADILLLGPGVAFTLMLSVKPLVVNWDGGGVHLKEAWSPFESRKAALPP